VKNKTNELFSNASKYYGFKKYPSNLSPSNNDASNTIASEYPMTIEQKATFVITQRYADNSINCNIGDIMYAVDYLVIQFVIQSLLKMSVT